MISDNELIKGLGLYRTVDMIQAFFILRYSFSANNFLYINRYIFTFNLALALT